MLEEENGLQGGHLEETAPAIAAVRPDVPPPLASLVERMMAKDPADRPQTPKAVATALAASTGIAPPAMKGVGLGESAGVLFLGGRDGFEVLIWSGHRRARLVDVPLVL